MDRDFRESMEEIHLRILRVTEDLRVIQRELNCAAMQAPTDPELMEALADPPEIESLQVLKSALDQMRHFLWFYLQVVTSDSEMGEKLRQSLRQDTPRNPPKWNNSSRTQPTRSCCAIWPTVNTASPTKLVWRGHSRRLPPRVRGQPRLYEKSETPLAKWNLAYGSGGWQCRD